MKKFYVYYHRDPREEYRGWKRYIGKGSKRRAYDFCGRHAKHGSWIKHLKSLGLKPIVEIVEYFEKEEDAFNKEMQLIKKYKEKGYKLNNMSDGGEGVSGLTGNKSYWFGKKKSQETKEKISKSRMGKYKGEENPFYNKKHTKEAKEKMSKSKKITLIGNKNKLGKTHTEEFKEECRKRMKGNTLRRRAVKCLNNGIIYESVVKACEELGLDNRSVYRVLKGEYSHTKKYKFEYVI